MAFGKLTVKAYASAPKKNIKAPSVKPAVKSYPLQEKGISSLNLLLIAPTCEEAEDYLCGLYFNLLQALTGSSLTAYTRDFTTINRLSELKQNLEEIVLKPVGGSYIRNTAEGETSLNPCTLTLGQSGNTALAMDLHFTCAEPEGAANQSADAVIVLLNCAESAEAAAKNITAARAAAAGRPVFCILTNFEKTQLFWGSDENTVPSVNLRRSLCELLHVSCQKNEYAVYAQIYGGLTFTDRKDGKAQLCANPKCREYMPVSCHIPVLLLMDALRKYRSGLAEDTVDNGALEKLHVLMGPHSDKAGGWYDLGYQNGGGTE